MKTAMIENVENYSQMANETIDMFVYSWESIQG